jgi:hypothetical protein
MHIYMLKVLAIMGQSSDEPYIKAPPPPPPMKPPPPLLDEHRQPLPPRLWPKNKPPPFKKPPPLMPPPPLLNQWGGFYPPLPEGYEYVPLPKGYEYVQLPKPPPPKPQPAVAQLPVVASQDDPPTGSLIQRVLIDSESESESEDSYDSQEAYEAAAAAMRGLREAPFEKPAPPPPPFARLNTITTRPDDLNCYHVCSHCLHHGIRLIEP